MFGAKRTSVRIMSTKEREDQDPEDVMRGRQGDDIRSGRTETSTTDGVDEIANRLYRTKLILAPMVRASTLPLRKLAIRYGADTVYTEEIIDHKLIHSDRVVNEKLGTIDYVDNRRKGGRSEKHLVLQIDPAIESNRLVLQIGTNDATRALKAALVAAKDINAVDINMCCPKHFSIHSGMGAGLLRKPETACDIIRTLRRNLNVPVSCKIRMLDAAAGSNVDRILATYASSKRSTACVDDRSETSSSSASTGKRTNEERCDTTSPEASQAKKKRKKKKRRRRKNTDIGVKLDPRDLPLARKATVEFMRQLEIAGASAIAVHARTASERRSNPAHLDSETLKLLCSSVSIPFIVSGDTFTRRTLDEIRNIVPTSSVMFARGALRNASVFRKDPLPFRDVIKEYLRESIRYRNYWQNTKYVIMCSLKENNVNADKSSQEWGEMTRAKSIEDALKIFHLPPEETPNSRASAVSEYTSDRVYSDAYFSKPQAGFL